MLTIVELTEIVFNASNFIYHCVWFLIQISSFMGQYLISQFVIIFHCLRHIFGLVNTLLRVAYEDFSVFFEDIKDKSKLLGSFTVNLLNMLNNGMNYISTTVISGITGIFNVLLCLACGIEILYSYSFFLVDSLIMYLGESLLLIGSSIWLAVVGAPRVITYILAAIVEQIQNSSASVTLLCISIYDAILGRGKDLYSMILRIPYGPVCGLVLALTLSYYTAINFRRIIASSIGITLNSCLCANSFLNHIWARFSLKRSNTENSFEDLSHQDKLCVVCQDKLKEIIVLPCRHVCLCSECSLYIKRNHKVCPLCCTSIKNTMKVYL